MFNQGKTQLTKPIYIINISDGQNPGIELLFILLIAGLFLYSKKRNILVTIFTILLVNNNSCKKQTIEDNPKIIKYGCTIKNI